MKLKKIRFRMRLNNNILPDNENHWAAFLNGEPDTLDFSNSEEEGMDDLTAVWEKVGTSYSYSAANPDQAWLSLQKKMTETDGKSAKKIFKLHIFRYAAMIAVVMGIAFATYKIVKTPGKQLDTSVQMAVAETEAHPANFTVITLPDGSTVKMNASTKIEYPEHFAADVRKVKLSGEAFFEVTKDTAHPFIIETKSASVEVLGTSFNVSAYPEAGLVEVNVKTGKVKLTQHTDRNTADNYAILPAGERGWLKVAEGEIGHEMIFSPNYSAWISKEMVFQRTPLAEAFAVLENTYHVKIRTENPEIGRIPYTANFANLKLDYIVEVIARTHKLKVVKNEGEIVFARIAN
jgi:transmembrane sensor